MLGNVYNVVAVVMSCWKDKPMVSGSAVTTENYPYKPSVVPASVACFQFSFSKLKIWYHAYDKAKYEIWYSYNKMFHID